ncbi:unnamed protein product [Rhizopus stolonifer]
MKLKTFGIAALTAASLLLCSQSQAKEMLIEDYMEPKHIVFMCMYGGSSNVNWVLSVLNELSKRGHKITYVTRELQARYAKPYPHFNTIVLEGEQTHLESAFALKRAAILDAAGTVLRSGYKDFQTDYVSMRDFIRTQNVSLALCSYANSPGCFEAARDSNIPDIITAAYAAFPDAGAPYVNNQILTMKNPTTLQMGFIQRFYDMFVVPVKSLLRMKPHSDWINGLRRLSNCNITYMEYEPWAHKNSLKLVNSLFGMETARPLGPLIEFIGPIMVREYSSLTTDLKEYLDSHSHIIYIAFGQHAVATESDLKLIITAIMESIEAGAYDGFLWASRKGAEAFPKEVKTKSGSVYQVNDMFDGFYSNLRFVNWAPQTAVVMHPSVSTFLTHGGAVSMFEGLYAGKRLIVFPFYGDQFINAHNTKYRGLGDYLSPELKQEEASNIIINVGRDVDSKIQSNVGRYRALVQIHSQHGVTRGADLVEEVLFVNKDSQLPYRYEVARQMPYIKSHNLDLIVAALFLTVIGFRIFVTLVKAFVRHILVQKWVKSRIIFPSSLKIKTN